MDLPYETARLLSGENGEGLSDSIAQLNGVDDYAEALERIMTFGYTDGHASGFTCADIAADALGKPRRKRRA